MRTESIVVEFNSMDGTPNEVELGDVDSVMEAMEPLMASGEIRGFRIYRDITIRERELVYDSDVA